MPTCIPAALLASFFAFGFVGATIQAQDLSVTEAGSDRIAARGRIEPVTGVRVLAAPPGSILEGVLVGKGDQVRADQVLAQTNRLKALDASVGLAEQRLAEARIGLARVQAPAKQSDRDAQYAVVEQRRAELTQATDAYERAQEKKGKKKSAPQEELEQRENAQAAAQRALDQAEATLRSLSEVREVDREAATAQVKVAEAQLKSARAERELGEIRAPIDGTILLLNARAGETADARGLLQMADLSQLMVIAEVDQRDVARVRVGAPARVSGGVLSTPVTGKVVNIANLVISQQRPGASLLQGQDARLVEVEIEPEGPLPPVIGGEVDVLISAP